LSELRIPLEEDRRECSMTVEGLLEIERIENPRILDSHYFDGGRIDELALLFCEDAVCEYSEEYGGNRVGRAAIRNDDARQATDEIPPYAFMHAVATPWIRLTAPDSANGRW
jgi:hypothetical protein